MFRKLSAALGVIAFSVVAGAGTAHAEDDVVYIVSRANNRCLDAPAEWNGANYTPIQLWDCYPPTQYNQMWRVHWVDNYHFQLINVAANRCLWAPDRNDGTRVRLLDCNSSLTQVWKALSTNTPGYRWIMGQDSAKVLDADAHTTGSNGTPVQLWYLIGDETQTNQRWTFKHAGDF